MEEGGERILSNVCVCACVCVCVCACACVCVYVCVCVYCGEALPSTITPLHFVCVHDTQLVGVVNGNIKEAALRHGFSAAPYCDAALHQPMRCCCPRRGPGRCDGVDEHPQAHALDIMIVQIVRLCPCTHRSMPMSWLCAHFPGVWKSHETTHLFMTAD